MFGSKCIAKNKGEINGLSESLKNVINSFKGSSAIA